MAQFDIDDDEYARQQAFANTLRKQAMVPGEMRGNVYVRKDPWAAFAEAAAGGFMGSKAAADRQAVEQQRTQQVKDWMGRMPSATTRQEAAGPMPDGSAMAPIEAPKAPRQYAQELQRHAMEGFELKSPLAQAVAQQGMQRAMAMPEKEAELADRAAQRQLELTLRADATAEQKRLDREAQKQRDADRRETQVLIKSMGLGQGRANADLDRQLKELRIEGERKKLTEGTAAEQKLKAAKADRETTLNEAMANIDMMLGDERTPGLLDKATASGVGSLVDTAAGFFGKATPGAIASAKLGPLADPILKMVPRFEGPQSDADVRSYKEAAGNLANPSLPAEVRKSAAITIKDIMTRRKGQFSVRGAEDAPSAAPSGGVVDFGSLK